MTTIKSQRIQEDQRLAHVATLFGVRFLWVESFAFDTASSLSPDYDGGLWDFYSLSNGGFFMAPAHTPNFLVHCANGFAGRLNAAAFGITACLYAYSHLSFSPDAAFANLCADQYHLVRAFAAQHAEADAINRATD